MYRSTGLSPDMQAAAAAKLSRAVLRGTVAIAAMVGTALDERQLPAAAEDVIADLCVDPKGWVVVSLPKSCYAYLRGPIKTDGVSVGTVDLRRIQPGTARPSGMDVDAWHLLYAAAKQYRERHSAPERGKA